MITQSQNNLLFEKFLLSESQYFVFESKWDICTLEVMEVHLWN